ncbi:unnamed protein product [Absidia cylindrospora]
MVPQPELPSNMQSHHQPHDTEVSMTSQAPPPPPPATTTSMPPVPQQQNVPLPDELQASNMRSDEDPIWMKCKSAVFRGAGAAQSKLGSAMGVSDLEHRGQEWEEWATQISEQANTMTEQGAPSRLHGEYNKWMGYMGKVLGHVSGDPEMEAKGLQRKDEANEEIEKARRTSA